MEFERFNNCSCGRWKLLKCTKFRSKNLIKWCLDREKTQFCTFASLKRTDHCRKCKWFEQKEYCMEQFHWLVGNKEINFILWSFNMITFFNCHKYFVYQKNINFSINLKRGRLIMMEVNKTFLNCRFVGDFEKL